MMSLIFKIPCLILILGLEVVNVYPMDSFSLEVKIEGVMVDKGTFYIVPLRKLPKFRLFRTNINKERCCFTILIRFFSIFNPMGALYWS